MKNFLLVPRDPNGGIMYLYIEGRIASLVHMPIFNHGDKEAAVTFTFGEPGVDESASLIVPIAYYEW